MDIVLELANVFNAIAALQADNMLDFLIGFVGVIVLLVETIFGFF